MRMLGQAREDIRSKYHFRKRRKIDVEEHSKDSPMIKRELEQSSQRHSGLLDYLLQR